MSLTHTHTVSQKHKKRESGKRLLVLPLALSVVSPDQGTWPLAERVSQRLRCKRSHGTETKGRHEAAELMLTAASKTQTDRRDR